MVLGLVAVGLLLLVYMLALKRVQKKTGGPLGRDIKQGFARRAARRHPAELIARLDDLRAKFEQGLETFKSAGKNIYNLPCTSWWRTGLRQNGGHPHCNVGFPPVCTTSCRASAAPSI